MSIEKHSSTSVFADLPLACYLANTTFTITNIMTTLIFIILIVSGSHAFFVVVPVHSSLHVLVVVAVISYFQHHDGVMCVWCEQSGKEVNGKCGNIASLLIVRVTILGGIGVIQQMRWSNVTCQLVETISHPRLSLTL